ncbi:hypothetical protein OGY18_00550 [Citrobacter sp. Cpo142]|uniref:hypothetical protein n=1 Tax=Citrobacter sp. Cpo142 TaxID=2985151 RepID=UPI0025791425|nr:hypothetical protein [Citrobacter sp. Cpo142]MDM2775663.1 hypothetical protein [Citrobacter sp. Cpo142]
MTWSLGWESLAGYAVNAVLMVAEFYAGLFLLFMWEGHKKHGKSFKSFRYEYEVALEKALKPLVAGITVTAVVVFIIR